ncbi:MAG: adenylate/guanylate cyclase domain-containing protein [Anaerolineales bacterium]|nr:adenylate/guanylate cyclase domain-containing protein [Anaerolineales bacterium]
MTTKRTSPTKKFQDLLLKFSQADEMKLRKSLEQKLWDGYGMERAVFVLDMSGFSLLTRKYGIVHYLSMVRRMQLTTRPIVESFEGTMIKYEADNCFALFPSPLTAVNAAVAMQHAFAASNLLTSDDLDIHIACGIDYGRILVVGGEDCFGDPVNRASKMGEDIAASGEVLISKDAYNLIPTEANIKARELKVSISGIEIPAYAVEYKQS